MPLLQPVKTPPPYSCHGSAATVIAIGPLVASAVSNAFASLVGFLTYPVHLTAAVYAVHVASRPLYGMSDSRAMPVSTVRLNASSIVAPSQPPVPPHSCGFLTQLTYVCGASSSRLPLAIWYADSTVSVALNAQHDPQPP
jgi:hypothetical protein